MHPPISLEDRQGMHLLVSVGARQGSPERRKAERKPLQEFLRSRADQRLAIYTLNPRLGIYIMLGFAFGFPTAPEACHADAANKVTNLFFGKPPICVVACIAVNAASVNLFVAGARDLRFPESRVVSALRVVSVFIVVGGLSVVSGLISVHGRRSSGGWVRMSLGREPFV